MWSDTPRSVYAGRHYWAASLCWLPGDALLAVVTKQGSLAVLSVLGEPVPLQVAGAAPAIHPARYLLLHPLLTLRSDRCHPAPDPAQLVMCESHRQMCPS